MNHRVSGQQTPRQFGWTSSRYVDVDARFRTRDEWLEYIRNLPKSRPDDLWLRITIGAVPTTLREGAYVFVEPWHLFVRNVYEPGLPGDLSNWAIGRSGPALTQATLIESANLLGLQILEQQKDGDRRLWRFWSRQ
jgi:hypothetical protein